MSRSFAEIYNEVVERELEFLHEFMFQLTILGRLVHIDLEDESKLQALKQINELNHRILNRVRDLGNEESWCKKEYLIRMVSHHISLAPKIESGVISAATKALAKVNV